MAADPPEVSHGRGGAGNITADDTQYADAEIVRAADEGTGVSTGRGGTFFWVVHNVVRNGLVVIYERRRPPCSFTSNVSPRSR